MELQEAIQKMNKGDYLSSIRGVSDHHITYTYDFIFSEDFRTDLDALLRDNWEVIPAEPKVLAAEEIIKKYACIDRISALNRRAILNMSINELLKMGFDFQEKGRLERDLELRELTEAAIDIKSLYYPHVINDREAHAKAINKLLHVSRNLKPLNKDD